MNEAEIFERFVELTIKNNEVWLLQAVDGMFAMTESADRTSFLAVWDLKEDAEKAISDEWAEYSLVSMDLKEWIQWLNEMQEDDAWIGIAPDENGKLIPIDAADLLRILVEAKKQQL